MNPFFAITTLPDHPSPVQLVSIAVAVILAVVNIALFVIGLLRGPEYRRQWGHSLVELAAAMMLLMAYENGAGLCMAVWLALQACDPAAAED